MVLLALLAVMGSAALVDVLSCAWFRARERRAYARGASIAALLEFAQWLPVLLALDAQAPLGAVVAASVAGSVLGSLLGFRGELGR